MKLIRNVQYAILLLFLIALPTFADNQAVLLTASSLNKIEPGQSLTTDLRLSGLSELQAFDLRVRYDPSVVTLADADDSQAGTQVVVAERLGVEQFYVVENQAEDGLIRVAGTMRAGHALPTGQIGLLSLTWQGVDYGPAHVTVEQMIVTDSNNVPIPVSLQVGEIEVAAPQQVGGQVLRQGRADHGGIEISQSGQTATSDSAGQFSLTAQGSYTLTLSAAGYLSQKLSGQLPFRPTNETIALPAITLSAGDINHDNQINIFDVSLIASTFNQPNGQADLNGDGIVNIFDLSLAAGNYGLVGE